MLQTDVDNKIITTTKTQWKDVIEKMDIVLAIGRKTKTCYIVRWFGGNAVLENPQFWGVSGGSFDTLWELQHFFDIYTFSNLTAIEDFMEEQSLIWGQGGN